MDGGLSGGVHADTGTALERASVSAQIIATNFLFFSFHILIPPLIAYRAYFLNLINIRLYICHLSHPFYDPIAIQL